MCATTVLEDKSLLFTHDDKISEIERNVKISFFIL